MKDGMLTKRKGAKQAKPKPGKPRRKRTTAKNRGGRPVKADGLKEKMFLRLDKPLRDAVETYRKAEKLDNENSAVRHALRTLFGVEEPAAA